jgi:hypothetical protein
VQWLYSKDSNTQLAPCTAQLRTVTSRSSSSYTIASRRDGHQISDAFVSAVSNDHLDVAQYLLESRLTTVSIDEVAGLGDLEMLKWLQINGVKVKCTINTMDAAAANGHLEVVQFLHENRTEGCSTRAMNQAARNGHLNIVKWLHFNQTDVCTVHVMDQAAENSHLAVVKFLHENRTEGCPVYAMDRAAGNGHLDVLQFIHEYRIEGCTVGAMDQAAANGHLEVVKFLHKNRDEGCTNKAMDRAHNLEILQWLDENRRTSFTNRAILYPTLHGDLEKLVWLRDHTPAEMWTPRLVESIQEMPSSCQVEMLEWLGDTFPSLVEAWC